MNMCSSHNNFLCPWAALTSYVPGWAEPSLELLEIHTFVLFFSPHFAELN